MKLKNLLIQFIKFGLVGAINTILSYLITNIAFYVIGLHEQVSNIIAFIITVFISFILNSKFVFKRRRKKKFLESVTKSICFIFYNGTILNIYINIYRRTTMGNTSLYCYINEFNYHNTN